MATNVTAEFANHGPDGRSSTTSVVISVADQVINPNSPLVDIIGVSVASPGVITTARAHQLTSGDHVTITGCDCTPTVNGDRVVTVLDAITFTVAVNTTGAGKVGTMIRTQTTVTADVAPSLVFAATDGVPPGRYEKVATGVFRRPPIFT
jgi:hypothetical protein